MGYEIERDNEGNILRMGLFTKPKPKTKIEWHYIAGWVSLLVLIAKVLH